MIQDSVPWKDELLRVAARLERKRTQKRWTERSGYLVERDLMVSAYAIRKLIEASKVSDALSGRSFIAEEYALLGLVPDFFSRFSFWELYDLESPRRASLSLREVCNQLIHSWMWAISATEQNEFDGVYVSSDRSRASRLYKFELAELINTIRDIGREDIVYSEILRGPDGQFRKTNIEGVLRDLE